MRVVQDSHAIEQQQLQVGQGPVGQEALLALADGPEEGEGQHASGRVQLAVLHYVGIGRVVQQACIWYQTFLT